MQVSTQDYYPPFLTKPPLTIIQTFDTLEPIPFTPGCPFASADHSDTSEASLLILPVLNMMMIIYIAF